MSDVKNTTSGSAGSAIAKKSSIRWLYLLLGMAVIFFLGVLYAWSIFKVPLVEAFGWSGSALQLNYTLTLCFWCIGVLAGGVFTRRFGIRVMLFVSAIFTGSGFCLVSTLDGSNIVFLYLFYGPAIYKC